MTNQFITEQSSFLEMPRAEQGEIRWEISFSDTNLEYITQWTIDEIERITRYQSNVEMPSDDDIKRYFRSLLYNRVCISRGDRLPEGIKPAFLRRLFVPARYATILSMVGEVVYPDVAVRILPKTSILLTEVMTLAEMIEVSTKLEKFFNDGLCGTLGFSMDRYGDPHFMNKVAIINGEPQAVIRSMTKDNPLYGFMAWLMSAELLEVAYDEAKYLLRVNYSAPDIYRSLGRMVWQSFQKDKAETKNNEDPYSGGARNIQAKASTENSNS